MYRKFTPTKLPRCEHWQGEQSRYMHGIATLAHCNKPAKNIKSTQRLTAVEVTELENQDEHELK